MSIVTSLVGKYSSAIDNKPWFKKYAVTRKVKPVAQAENKRRLEIAIKQCERLGETADGKIMYLYQYIHRSPILREVGRLRELSFRAVGEGTNKRRDIDRHDKFYYHLILWDNNDKEIVGAYRFGDAKKLMHPHKGRLYSTTLFTYHKAMQPYLEQGLELGRSFVQPKYWGKRSLDYLWFGIGAFLKKYPRYRYLFGPVSLSNELPEKAKSLIVSFYSLYFGSGKELASPLRPYCSADAGIAATVFSGTDYKEDFTTLKKHLQDMDANIPTLYKQYTEAYNEGGVHFLGFNIDPDFNDCIDGLVLADLTKLKEKKRLRYMSRESVGLRES